MSDFVSYITYSEYVSFGGKVASSDFSALERKTQRYFDVFTQDRCKSMTTIPSIVKEALTEMINKVSEFGSGERVSSFSNGKVTMSFDLTKSEEQELFDVASQMLPLSIISRAVDKCE